MPCEVQHQLSTSAERLAGVWLSSPHVHVVVVLRLGHISTLLKTGIPINSMVYKKLPSGAKADSQSTNQSYPVVPAYSSATLSTSEGATLDFRLGLLSHVEAEWKRKRKAPCDRVVTSHKCHLGNWLPCPQLKRHSITLKSCTLI